MLSRLKGGTRKTSGGRDLRSTSVSSVVVLLSLTVLFAAAIGLQVVRETRYPLPATTEESLYLTRQAANRIAFSFRPLGADLYWIRAIQYYGSRKREIDAASLAGAETAAPSPGSRPALNYDLLYPLFIYTIRSARNHQDGRMPRYSPKDYRIRGAPMLRRAEKQLTLTIKQHNRGRRR